MKGYPSMCRQGVGVAGLMVAAVLACTVVGAAGRPAAAQDLSGSYRTADGRVEHTFQPEADYSATVVVGTRILSFSGLYQEGKSVCLATSPDRRKGGVGNVLLYIGGNECCLAFRPISDKMAVTRIGMMGDTHGPGFFLCHDQMLERSRVGAPPPPPEPPMSTARPRTLVPGGK
jgi:hypothetical protein